MPHVIEPSEIAVRAVAVSVFVDQGTRIDDAIVCRFLDPQRRDARAFSAKVEIGVREARGAQGDRSVTYLPAVSSVETNP
jgi:hypothetical protein